MASRGEFLLGMLRPDRIRRRKSEPLLSAHHHHCPVARGAYELCCYTRKLHKCNHCSIISVIVKQKEESSTGARQRPSIGKLVTRTFATDWALSPRKSEAHLLRTVCNN